MISDDFKNHLPEADLAALLHGLRYRGLAVGPDDARKVATVFRHAQDWSHQRRVRVLKSLLARNEEERRLLDQLAPFLFVEAQIRVEDSSPSVAIPSHQEEGEPVQPRFSSLNNSVNKTPPLPVPLPPGERGAESVRLEEYAKNRQRRVNLLQVGGMITMLLFVALMVWRFYPSPPPVDTPPATFLPPAPDIQQDTLRGPKMIPDTYEPPLPPRWPFWLILGFACVPVVVVVPRSIRFRRQSLNLKTLAASTGPRTYRFDLRPEEVDPLLDANLVRDAAFHLSAASAEAPAPWLNVRQTVEHTVRNAGRLTLCFDSWLEHRPVLFIEDCAPSMVRWPDVGRHIADALARQGGTVAHYYMDRTLERLFADRESQADVPLEQVLTGLGDPTVVLLSDAATVDPYGSVTQHAWVGALSHAVWLHPQAADLWGPGSRWLAERVRMTPLSDEGLLRVGSLRASAETALPRRWRPPQLVRQKRLVGQKKDQYAESRVAVLRVALGEDAFWWLAAGAVLDHVGALTTRTWWGLRSDKFLPMRPSRESCNRVWELPDMQVGADGTVRLATDLREALVERLKQEHPQIVSRVATWAETRVQQDLDKLEPQTLAAVEARTLLGRLQLLDPKKHRVARRTVKQLAREGFGEWVTVNEAEEGVLRRLRFSLVPTKQPTRGSIAVATAGALGMVLALAGLQNPERFLSRTRVVRITLNAPATADASGAVALSWVLQEKDEAPPTQWHVQRDGQDVAQVDAPDWQDTPAGSGPWRYQVLADGLHGQVYRSDFYEVAAAVTQPPPPPVGQMVSIPAGDFFMGCNEKVDTECFDNEKSGKTLNLPTFFIDKTEVTVAQFAQCVAKGKCSDKGLTMPYYDDKEQPDLAWACNWGKSGREQHPINCVDWNQAQAFCKWAGKRLPSEAEWEKAARGTDGRKYPWGNQGYKGAEKVANIADEALKRKYPDATVAEEYDDGFVGTAPVASFLAGESPFHALDMIGNVWEWTADWYDEKKTYRSVRGGSWPDRPQFARASYRYRFEPGSRGGDIGFRCAQ